MSNPKLQRAVGIYSFPKSGNTWARHILGSILQLELGGKADTLGAVPDLYELKQAELLTRETPRQSSIAFYKSHSSDVVAAHNSQLIHNDFILYIIRNPLDVFLSQLNYLCRGFDKKSLGVIAGKSVKQCISDNTFDDLFSSFLCFGTLTPHFRDAGSWFEQVNEWHERSCKNESIHIVRYEDMLNDPLTTILPLAYYLGYEQDQLELAIQIAETKCHDGGKFFWSKKSANFLEYMHDTHAEKLFCYYRPLLDKLGYVDFILDSFRQKELSLL